ncbi:MULTISPECIES: DUF6745 domain-containing protein [Thermomonosporaceae]|uniref:DUF6745 domain-containing protein n=1 Tax=Thermomonosporaceae TaxID=2012 RepID=UPI00255AF412|nr:MULTISPECIES: hypothetical protein [Thermomonosporaceae]MDL4775095.1 hypothetical protein [Actinomadura xylanilytica]
METESLQMETAPGGAVRGAQYVVGDWQSAGFATGPADRERAEAGITAAYAAAGLDAPERFVWVSSPAHGAVAAAFIGGYGATEGMAELARFVDGADLDGAGSSVRDAVRTRPWERERTAASAELGPERWATAWAETGGLLWDPVNGLVARVRQAIGALAGDGSEAESLLRAATLDAVLGQQDAPWLALFESLGRLDGPLAGLAEAARSAGWWWPYERVVVVSERPDELYRDEPGRLHRGDGPALAYPGGFALHAWRGMPIPADFVASLAEIDAARIAGEPNSELRRVMLEIFGYDRYLAETGARPLHRDETGVLWSIDLPGDEPVVMVEVVNSTPEPDGSYRTYYLRVPPDTRTARAGVAWTFGVPEADYQPEKQT